MEYFEKDRSADMPSWLLQNEIDRERADKDTFVDKSILSVFHVISKIKRQDYLRKSALSINVPLKMLCTLLLILFVSLSKSMFFITTVFVYLLVLLCLAEGKELISILKTSFMVTLLTALLMVPSFIMGNYYSAIMIPIKVFLSITAMGLLSHSSRFGELIESLRVFHIPNIFIMILDITIKYIYLLGTQALHMFYALKLRLIGRNRKKYNALGGITGNLFLQSKEMSEEMYQAMVCRGYSGIYPRRKRKRLTWQDLVYLLVNLGIFILAFMEVL